MLAKKKKRQKAIDIKTHVSGFRTNFDSQNLEFNLYGSRLSSIPILIYCWVFLSWIYILWLSQGQIIVLDKLWLWSSMSFTVLRLCTQMFISFPYSCNNFLNLLRGCGWWCQEKQSKFPWIVLSALAVLSSLKDMSFVRHLGLSLLSLAVSW